MAFDETSPPKKRWQQSCSTTPPLRSFTLDASQWHHQSVLVFDQYDLNSYRMGVIEDIVDSRKVTVSLKDQSPTTVTVDLASPHSTMLPPIIIDNIPACQDLLVGTDVCVRQEKNSKVHKFICGRIKAKHATRLEFCIDFKDSNNNSKETFISDEKDGDNWYTRQHIRLLLEPWHEEMRLFRESGLTSNVFRPITFDLDLIKNHDQNQNSSPASKTPFPTPPIENKDDDDDDIEGELQKPSTGVNKLQGIKKGDIFTMG